ncbi:MAG TPA: AMP-binding protein, partial [Acidimicrobiales bacterium]|nr:AMP-binding protein [Acidimicrobiales bacterium]
MTNRHFGDFVASFTHNAERLALTIRPFLKIEHLTYGELQQRAYRTAHYLLEREVARGDRIMVVAANSPDWVELFLGTQLIGAILVPVDVSSTPATTLQFVGQTKPKLIFRNQHLHPELAFPTVEVLEELNERASMCPATALGADLTGDCPAVIVFTSGTTADPKGVVLTQDNILADADAALRRLDVRPDWRFLSLLPLSHMYELTSLVAELTVGVSIFYVPSTSSLAVARALQEYHATTVLVAPQILTLLLERIRQAAAAGNKARKLALASKLAAVLPFSLRRLLFRDVHSQLGKNLNLFVTGGAPVPIAVGTAWERMGVRVLQGYGLTETGPILTMNPLHGRRLDSAGRALDNVRLRIGEDGEIQAEGPSIFHEYWQNPTASREAFTKDGWFKTGDAGYLQDGWLHIEGRLKFVIVLSSGLKVFPEDVELVAAKYPLLRAVCVVGVRRPGGEEVVAVVISDHSDSEIAQTIEDINAHLESFQHISDWRRWPDARFPLTRLLKIDHRKVQDWANQAGERQPVKSREVPSEDEIVSLIRQSTDEPDQRIGDSDRLA